MRIVLASSNTGKIKEFESFFSNTSVEWILQSALSIQDVEETQKTFIENAILKARHASLISKLPAVSDDSGLTVNALHGRPGVLSSRYAPTDAKRIEKLLVEMQSVPDEKRTAEYHSVIAFLLHADDPAPMICHGIWKGAITRAPRGTNGFGYDPIFFVPTHDCTAAELSTEEKNRISHRGQAMQQLIKTVTTQAPRLM